MNSFAEIQFPPEISYGSKGGPQFSTDIVTTFSGHEQGSINWQEARSRYDISSGIKTEYQSINNGYDYKAISAINAQATTGFTLNKIPPASPLLFDESTEIIIQLLYGKLQSVNELALLSGANKALIGDELIQFQNAELIGDKKYKLTSLLRGRQGTEWAINSHKIGDKFILLNKEIINISIPNNLIGKAINYKAVTIGKTLAETESVTFTYTGRALKPFASVYATVEKDADGNIKISWLRRSRIDNDWRDYVDIPIGEDIEKYEIDIKKNNKTIRTLETTAPNVIYPKEQILSDFTTFPDNLTATIYQLSSQIGRGYGTTIILN